MSSGLQCAARAVDITAAAILGAAVAFAASSLASITLAAFLTPLAFASALAALRKLDHPVARPLASFEVQPIEPPQPVAAEGDGDKVIRLFEPRQLAIARPSLAVGDRPSGDAGRALSEALSQLKRSLR